MFHQIEITTRCNFECFYCAGRSMPQRHMDWALFESILAGIPPGSTVSLQGEGEPFLHPRFRDMVAAIRAAGLVPYVITNATLIDDPAWVAACFPSLGVSLDTLDPELSRQTGRIDLPRVLDGLERLRQVLLPASRLILHTVDFGQPLEPVREYARAQGFKHLVQPLQPKDDYARYYASAAAWGPCSFRCRYLEQPLMRFYNLDGVEMPCCFIKDTRQYHGAGALAAELAAGQVPAPCRGCREIFPGARVGAW
jgi:MoaA/NifB/PqqE/SkfB family radical SAM enzyme